MIEYLLVVILLSNQHRHLQTKEIAIFFLISPEHYTAKLDIVPFENSEDADQLASSEAS